MGCRIIDGRDVGYATGFVGKWHLNPTHEGKEWMAPNNEYGREDRWYKHNFGQEGNDDV